MHIFHTFIGCLGFFSALFGLVMLFYFCFFPLKKIIENVKCNFFLLILCLFFIIIGSWLVATTYSKPFALRKINELLTERTYIEMRLKECKKDAANASDISGIDFSNAFNYKISEYQKRYEKNEEKLRYWYDRATKDEN